MNYEKLTRKSGFPLGTAGAFAFMAMALSGCNSVDVTSSAGSKGTTSIGAVAITQFQGNAPAAWITDATGATYTANRAVEFDGTCGLGIAAVTVLVGGNATGTAATCNPDGTFSWLNTFTTDVSSTFQFVPTLVDGTLVAASAVSQAVVIDTLIPAVPTIATVGGLPFATPFISRTSSVVIAGTVDTTTTKMTVDNASGSLTFNAAAGTFNYAITLTQGTTTTINFKAYNVVNTPSNATTIVLSFVPSTTINGNIAFFSGTMLAVPLAQTNGTMNSVNISPFQGVGSITGSLGSGILFPGTISGTKSH